MVYVEDQDTYVQENEVPAGVRTLNISGTDLRRRLSEGRELPSWFTFEEVARELQRNYPPRHRQGLLCSLPVFPDPESRLSQIFCG